MERRFATDYGQWPPSVASNAGYRRKAGNAWTNKEEEKKKMPLNTKDKKYTSFKVYIRDILKHSLITSVPQITVSKNWAKKFIKISVFILCLIGFVYQALDFLWFYLSYPTVVNVVVSNPFEITQPAITICNNNNERRSAVCATKDIECFHLDEEKLCRTYPRYCSTKIVVFTGIPYPSFIAKNSWNWDDEEKWSHNETMFRTCELRNEKGIYICNKDFQHVPVVTSTGEPNICFTMESLWQRPDVEPDIYANTFNYFLEVDTQPDEYIIYTEPISLQVAIHDRRRLVNPYQEGFRIKGGLQYEVTVSMTEKQLLPTPYDTNCTDYVKLWKKNNGTGPLNDLMCIEYCKLNTLLERGQCIDKNVGYPNKERICDSGVITATSDIIENCKKSCRPPCRDYTYEARYEVTNSYDHVCKREWCRKAYAKMSIYFKQLQLTKFHYRPKFESVELFSYIGGYMGMWLGLSLISLFDLFETVSCILYFPIGLWKWKRKIKPSHGNIEMHTYHSHIY